LEPEFYIEKIPTSKTELDKLKKDRDTASLEWEECMNHSSEIQTGNQNPI
jgi:hypothetical protein